MLAGLLPGLYPQQSALVPAEEKISGTFVRNFSLNGPAEDVVGQQGQLILAVNGKTFTGRLLVEGRWVRFKGKFEGSAAAVNLPTLGAWSLSLNLLGTTQNPSVFATVSAPVGRVTSFTARPVLVGRDSFSPGAMAFSVLFEKPVTGLAGYGFARLTTSRNGTARLRGELADGSKFSTTARLAPQPESDVWNLPVAVPLRSIRGLLIGEPSLDLRADRSESHVWSGSVFWHRPPNARAKVLSGGLVAPLRLHGSVWKAADRGINLLTRQTDTEADFELWHGSERLAGRWPVTNRALLEVSDSKFSASVVGNRRSALLTGRLPRTLADGKERRLRFRGLLIDPPLELQDEAEQTTSLLHGAGYFIKDSASWPVEVITDP